MNAETEVRVAGTDDVPAGSGIEVAVDGRVIALFNVDGKYYALDGMCPHSGGPLGQGQLNGCIVTCPWHGWQFDVTTGVHSLTDNIVHQSFEVRVAGDDIFIRLATRPES